MKDSFSRNLRFVLSFPAYNPILYFYLMILQWISFEINFNTVYCFFISLVLHNISKNQIILIKWCVKPYQMINKALYYCC